MTRLVLLTLALAIPLHASTLDTIRAQFLAYETGAGADPTTARMQAARDLLNLGRHAVKFDLRAQKGIAVQGLPRSAIRGNMGRAQRRGRTRCGIDHGASPAGATAAYAIVANTTAAAMAGYVPPRILANDGSVSAVQSGGEMGIVFWTAGSFAGVTTTAPAIVWLTPSDVYVTDPTNGQGDFTLTVGSARFTIPRSGGTTFHAHLTPRRRSVLP